MQRIPVILTLLAFGSFGTASPVEIWSATDLSSSSDRLAATGAAKSIAGNTLGAWGNHSASLWRRTKSGEAELHKTKTDLIVVEQGSATLIFGGTIPIPEHPHPARFGARRFAAANRGRSAPAISSGFPMAHRINSYSERGRPWHTSPEDCSLTLTVRWCLLRNRMDIGKFNSTHFRQQSINSPDKTQKNQFGARTLIQACAIGACALACAAALLAGTAVTSENAAPLPGMPPCTESVGHLRSGSRG